MVLRVPKIKEKSESENLKIEELETYIWKKYIPQFTDDGIKINQINNKRTS